MTTDKIHILSAALTLAALLTSCSEDDFSTGAGSTGIPMQIEPSITGSTKASMQTADLTEFYLQVTSTEAAYSYFDKVSKSGTAWSASKTPLWPDETALVTYSAAYYSGHAFTADEFAQGVDLTVPTDQSTQAGLNSADLLTLKATQTSYEKTDNGVLPVALNHALAKVNLVLTLGDAFYDAKLGLTANPVTAFTVKGANTGFNFKPQTGAVTVTTGTEADITPLPGTYTPATATTKTATAVYEAILVPQTFAAGALTATFSVGQGNYVWTNATAITLAAGTTVNLPLSATTAPPVDPYNGHEYVDLGLPSGLKWATCNVGATKPEEYGDYFAWGDTVPYYEPGHAQDTHQNYWKEGKSGGYHWSSYKWCKGSSKTLTKYCNNGTYGYNGFTDSKTTLDPEDDAARYQWGGSWRMPTQADCQELIDNCKLEKTEFNGILGYKATSKKYEDRFIFLPAAGRRKDTDIDFRGDISFCWSSSLYTDEPYGAYCLTLSYYSPESVDVNVDKYTRINGSSVRPVCK